MLVRGDRSASFEPGVDEGASALANGLQLPKSSEQRFRTNVIAIRPRPISPTKRIVDILISVAAIIFFGPLMVFIALMIKLSDGGPVFFAQSRIGYNGAEFKCYKFRTMERDAEKCLADYLTNNEAARKQWDEMQKLTNDPRVTSLGQFLRLSSLDELPQFFNVLSGDMSIVGPRPIVGMESARYGRYFADYCTMRPGLTGLWQVSGRNDTTYRRRVAIDVFYCRNYSLALDLLVILKTPWVIIRRSGAY